MREAESKKLERPFITINHNRISTQCGVDTHAERSNSKGRRKQSSNSGIVRKARDVMREAESKKLERPFITMNHNRISTQCGVDTCVLTFSNNNKNNYGS
ncbi:hypothetical protein JTB14_036899 [Gonioctena quinquepunctata]|nr:hypothetical protein JTB14_036899 [Gonioctena quinquepunctata]